MLSPESPRKNKLLKLSTFCMNHSIILKRPETQKERKTNTYRRSWWRHWDNRKSYGEINFVHIFIPSVHFKQKSEVSEQKLSSQRLQRLFPILHEKGSFYSQTAIRSKQTDYANFQKKKKRVYTISIFKENKFRKMNARNLLPRGDITKSH